MEDVNFGPDESMDDEIGEDEDAEMDFGEDTGSEDTSRTDDDDMEEEDDEEVDVDDETGESEGAWQDEEDGADLVENGEEGEGDEEADDGVIWPEVCSSTCLWPLSNSVLHRGLSRFRERRMKVMTKKASEVHFCSCPMFGPAELAHPGVPVILGEEEEEDEDEEWTSPQDGYVEGPKLSPCLP
jgi:hypothetical protein